MKAKIDSTVTFNSKVGKWSKAVGISCITIFLAGCAGVALHHDMVDNNQVYANSTNEQLLINLARAASNEPPYFVQLGTINNQHTFTGTASFQPADNVSAVHPAAAAAATVTRAINYGATVMGTATENPSFSFTPLAGSDFSKDFTYPVDEKIFLTYFEEGQIPADILARILIQSVAVIHPKDNHHKTLLINDPDSPTYVNFLQFCSYLRYYQYNSYISVGKKPDSLKLENGEAVSFDVSTTTVYPNAPKPPDLATAMYTDGFQFKMDKSNKHLIMSFPNVYLHLEVSGPIDKTGSQSDQVKEADLTSSLTAKDFEGMFPRKNADGSSSGDVRCEFVMRNFSQVLSALAKEQSFWDDLASNDKKENAVNYYNKNKKPGNTGYDIEYHKASYERPVLAHLWTYYKTDVSGSYNPHSEVVLPILLMRGLIPVKDSCLKTLIEIDHGGLSYYIADLVKTDQQDISIDYDQTYCGLMGWKGQPEYIPGTFSNRGVFSVLASLFNQVAADPKNLPTQQLIQVQ